MPSTHCRPIPGVNTQISPTVVTVTGCAVRSRALIHPKLPVQHLDLFCPFRRFCVIKKQCFTKSPEAAQRGLSQNTITGCARRSGDGGTSRHPWGSPRDGEADEGKWGEAETGKRGWGGSTGNKTVTFIIPTPSPKDGASSAAAPPTLTASEKVDFAGKGTWRVTPKRMRLCSRWGRGRPGLQAPVCGMNVQKSKWLQTAWLSG